MHPKLSLSQNQCVPATSQKVSRMLTTPGMPLCVSGGREGSGVHELLEKEYVLHFCGLPADEQNRRRSSNLDRNEGSFQ